MATFVPTRSDSEEEELTTQPAPAFRRPLAVGIGILVVFACTTAALLAAGRAYRGTFRGTAPKQVHETAATAMQDLDELLEVVQDDLNGGILGDEGLDQFLSEDADDAGDLLDEAEEVQEDAFPRRIQQKWSRLPVVKGPQSWQDGRKPKAAQTFYGIFKAADKDDSGFIEVSELDGAAHLADQKLDMPINKMELAAEVNAIWDDGKLGPKEFSHALGHLLLFKKLDKDGNGKVKGVELERLRGILKKRFGVTPKQFQQILVKAGPVPAGQVGPPALVRIFAEAEAAYVPPAIMRFFKKADKDSNAKIQGEELDFVKTSLQERFSLPPQKYQQLLHSVDSDHDNMLTAQELKQMVSHGFYFASEQAPALKQLPRRLALLFIKSDFNGDGLIGAPKELDFLSGTIQRKFQMLPVRYDVVFREADKNRDGRLGPLEFQVLVSKGRQEKGKKSAQMAPAAGDEMARPTVPKQLRAPGAWQPFSNHAF